MSEYYPYNYKGYPDGFKSNSYFTMPTEKERDLRWNALRKAMKKYNLDCLIVSGTFGHINVPNNIYYISNYVPFFNPGTYIVFPVEGEPQLGVSNSIGPQFEHCASETSWIREISGSLKPVEDVISKIKSLKIDEGRLGIVGYEMGIFPASVNDILHETFPNAIFEDGSDALNDAMNEVSRSSEEELAFLRKTAEIHDLSFKAVAAAMKPGVTEQDLWAVAEKAIIENGGWYPHFMLVTSGPSPIFPRAPASYYKLNMGDIIIFEINVIYGGILSQICYALSLGRPDKQSEKMYDFVQELYQYSLEEHGKKRNCGDIEMALTDKIHDAGYEPMTPQIHIYNQAVPMPEDSPAQPGDYFIVHPNFCDRNYTVGAKFGDTIRIDKDGKVERLQNTPAKLNVIDI